MDERTAVRLLHVNLAELTRLIDSWLAVVQDVHTPDHERQTADLHLARLRRYADSTRAQLAALRQEARRD